MNDSEHHPNVTSNIFFWGELGPYLAFYGLTFITGLCGNILIVFTTYRYRRMHNVTNVFLASLAIADLLLIVICVPVKVGKLFSFAWEMGEFLCKGVYYVQNVSAFCSVLTLTAISIERYYAIVHPMKAKYICTISQAKRIICLTWVLAFVLAIPILFVQIHQRVGIGGPIEAYYCIKNWDATVLLKVYEIYTIICLLIIPFFIMTFAYTMICREVWRVMESRTMMTIGNSMNENSYDKSEGVLLSANGDGSRKYKNSKNDTKTTKQVIYMLVTIVLLFAICWAPLLVCDLLIPFDKFPQMKHGVLKFMYSIFNCLAYVNSCINPIMYGFMSKNFRESFQNVLCCSSAERDMRASSRLTSSMLVSRTGSQTRHTIAKPQIRSSIV